MSARLRRLMGTRHATPAMTAADTPAHTEAQTDATALLHFNCQMLDQALALVAAHESPGGPDFSDTVGPHLRHVIEHFEALLLPLNKGVADYDSRARDRHLERQPALARQRLLKLQLCLQACTSVPLSTPLQVRGLGGPGGEFGFAVASSFGRELAFVASHAVHHHALLQAHCRQHGIAVDAAFGVAPATAAHARAATTALVAPESPCHALPA
jgi:hypothetical protein